MTRSRGGSGLTCRVKPTQFGRRGGGCEPPGDGGGGGLTALGPGGDRAFHGVAVRQALGEALALEKRRLRFRHVAPTAVFGTSRASQAEEWPRTSSFTVSKPDDGAPVPGGRPRSDDTTVLRQVVGYLRAFVQATVLHLISILVADRWRRTWTAVSWVVVVSHLSVGEGRRSHQMSEYVATDAAARPHHEVRGVVGKGYDALQSHGRCVPGSRPRADEALRRITSLDGM
jgi:hypothetical protein